MVVESSQTPIKLLTNGVSLVPSVLVNFLADKDDRQ